MKIENFEESWFLKSKTFSDTSTKFSGGQVTIVGGSELFHGAPILALKACSRIASMVYFATPLGDKGVADEIKSQVQAFVWIPEDEIVGYIAKSDAVLIGPGMMRSKVREHGFVCDVVGQKTRDLTMGLFQSFPNKKWIVDGGALQVIRPNELPKGAIITPNKKEFEMLFGEVLLTDDQAECDQISRLAKEYNLIILVKDDTSLVSDGETCIRIEGGGPGMVKGGVGDVTAGVILGFFAKDEPMLAVSFASYITKQSGKSLTEERDMMFSAQDLADRIPLEYAKARKALLFSA